MAWYRDLHDKCIRKENSWHGTGICITIVLGRKTHGMRFYAHSTHWDLANVIRALIVIYPVINHVFHGRIRCLDREYGPKNGVPLFQKKFRDNVRPATRPGTGDFAKKGKGWVGGETDGLQLPI